MHHILLEPLVTETGTYPPGFIAESDTSAHLLRSKGGRLLPFQSEGVKGLLDFATRFYPSENKTSPYSPSVIPGPIVYIAHQVTVHWMMRLECKPRTQGRISMVPSTVQSGNGMVRLSPLDQTPCDLESDLRGGIVEGQFYVSPMQHGFAAFDFYVTSPEIITPRWAAISLIRMA